MALQCNDKQTGQAVSNYHYHNDSPDEISFTAADSLVGYKVFDTQGKYLGVIDAVMLDVPNGRIAYVMLSHGGFFGLGVKRFAIPWKALIQDASNEVFILERRRRNVLKNTLVLENVDWSTRSVGDERRGSISNTSFQYIKPFSN